MRIGVVGAGAVGSYFGALFSRAGFPVVLLGRGRHIEAVVERGLQVLSIDGDFCVSPQVTLDAADAGVCDLLLFCVKSYDTELAARAMAPMLGAESVILSLQNGIENESRLEVLYPGRVLPGLCYVGARIDEPGVVIHSAAGRVIFGEADGSDSQRVREVAAAFARASIPAKTSPEISRDLWTKLLWNLSFNSVSALTRCTVEEMLSHAEGRRALRRAMDEAVAVARANGVLLDPALPNRVLESSVGFGALKTSMLQDVEKGRPLEVDALNGAVVRLGRSLGVPTPCNEMLLDCVLLLSARNARSSGEGAQS